MKQETGETFKFSDCPVSRIVGVQLGLMSSDEIVKIKKKICFPP